MHTPDLEFAALKDMANLMYLLNFEAIATAANDEDAFVVVEQPGSIRSVARLRGDFRLRFSLGRCERDTRALHASKQ